MSGLMQLFRRRTTWLWTLSLTLCLVDPAICHAAESDDQILSEIISAQKKAITLLRTLEYKSVVNTSGTPEFNQYFAFDRGRYRGNVDAPKATGKFHREYAFDGKTYQDFDGATSRLAITAQSQSLPGYFVMESVVLSHVFAVKPKSGYSLELSTLQSDEIWDAATKAASVLPNDKTRSDVRTVRFTWVVPEGEVIYDVDFSKSLDWSPIAFAAKNHSGVVFASSKISYKEVKNGSTLAKTAVHFPADVTIISGSNQGGSQKTTSLIANMNTVRVNEQIPVEVFTIPRTQANLFIDNGLRVSNDPGNLNALEAVPDIRTNKSVDRTALSAANSDAASGTRTAIPLVVVGLLVAGVIVGVVVFKRRDSSLDSGSLK